MAAPGRRSGDTVVAIGAVASAVSVVRKGWSARSLATFTTIALRRAASGGSRGLLYVGAAATGLRVLHRAVGKREDILRIKLKPGQALEIREIVRTK